MIFRQTSNYFNIIKVFPVLIKFRIVKKYLSSFSKLIKKLRNLTSFFRPVHIKIGNFRMIEISLFFTFHKAPIIMGDREKKLLLSNLLKILNIARVREKKIRALCSSLWIKKLKYMRSEGLTRKLKFVLGNCSFSTIHLIYKKGLLGVSTEWIKFARFCVARRNMALTSKVQEILRGKI